MTSVAPAVPVDTLLQTFLRAVEAFEASPTAERLRELERLAAQLMARARELGPAALALLRGAVARVIGVLAGPTVTIGGGAVLGAGLFWWGFFTMLSAHMEFPDPSILAGEIATGIASELIDLHIDLTSEAARRCFETFKRDLADEIRAAGGSWDVLRTPDFQRRLERLIRFLLGCLMPGLGNLTESVRHKLMEILKRLLVGAGLLGAGLLGGAGDAYAGEPEPDYDDPELGKAVRDLGLAGIPRGDGFAHCETIPDEEVETPVGEPKPKPREEKPCDPMPWEVDLRVGMDLGAFTDEHLKMRKAILDCWIAYYERIIEEDRVALEKGDGDTDSRNEDLLRLRIQVNGRELERVRRAKQNVERECQLRELADEPAELAPPLESRLEFRWPF